MTSPDAADSLEKVRAEIDETDELLVSLFVRRLKLIDRLVSVKTAEGRPICDPEREQEILDRVASEVPAEHVEGARRLFTTLFSIAKARQRELMRFDIIHPTP